MDYRHNFQRYVVLFHHGSHYEETTVFGVFHPDAKDLFNIRPDLKKVA
jgi:hypothetical protein